MKTNKGAFIGYSGSRDNDPAILVTGSVKEVLFGIMAIICGLAENSGVTPTLIIEQLVEADRKAVAQMDLLSELTNFKKEGK